MRVNLNSALLQGYRRKGRVIDDESIKARQLTHRYNSIKVIYLLPVRNFLIVFFLCCILSNMVGCRFH